MRIALTLFLLLPLALAAQQGEKHGEKERKDDARRHRILAQAHEAAAKCLEAGKDEKVCLEQLRKDCKGAGIGKYCGLKHHH